MNAKSVALISIFLALMSGAAELAWSQSTDAPQANASPGASNALRLLIRPLSHIAANSQTRSLVPDAVARGLATARVYRFASADYPGAAVSVVTDENNSTVVGGFNYSTNSSPSSPETGFTLKAGLYQAFTVPGSLSGTIITGINTGGETVGFYADFSGVTHGFLDKAGVITNIDESVGQTIPYEINDSGKIVGSDGTHGFSTSDGGASFTDFDVPGATRTAALGVNSAGAIVGQWEDSGGNSHGFLLSGGVYTSVDFPLATGTVAWGINDSNEIAGSFTDADGVVHGFIYSAGAYAVVDVAGATGTELTRIKNNGHVTGAYSDSLNEEHGLTGH